MFNKIKDKDWHCELVDNMIECKNNKSEMDVVKFLGDSVKIRGFMKVDNSQTGRMVVSF